MANVMTGAIGAAPPSIPGLPLMTAHTNKVPFTAPFAARADHYAALLAASVAKAAAHVLVLKKPLVINPENDKAIRGALRSVNGHATQHTFTDASEVHSLTETASVMLDALSLTKAERVGARVSACSGSDVAAAYNNARIGTRIDMVLGASGLWRIEKIERETLFTTTSNRKRFALTLTATQDEAAVRRLRARYAVTPRAA